MATIHFSNELLEHTGGLEAVAIEAPRVQELIQTLISRFPDLAPVVQEMAVAVDGEIYQDASYVRLRSESDVHLVPRVAGG